MIARACVTPLAANELSYSAVRPHATSQIQPRIGVRHRRAARSLVSICHDIRLIPTDGFDLARRESCARQLSAGAVAQHNSSATSRA
jgi:hypothetical protein